MMRKIVLLIIMLGVLIVSVTNSVDTIDNIEETISSNEPLNLTVYFPRLPDFNLINEEIKLDGNMNIEEKIKFIIGTLTNGVDKANVLDVIPNGSRLNNVYIDEKTAYLDFSQEFVDNHPGGSLGEYNTIYSIVNSITEINGIESVVFLIEGKKQSTYKGHCQFDIPISRDESLIVKH